MVIFEGFLATLAYASVIVATLRAGSRALYLTEHDSIGVMQGPPILGPDDVTNRSMASPVWDLSYPFQQGVRLALFPESFRYQQGDAAKDEDIYTMTPPSHSAAVARHDEIDEIPSLDGGVDEEEVEDFNDLVEQAVSKPERKSSYFHRYVKVPTSYLSSQIQQSVSPRVETAREWILERETKILKRFKSSKEEDVDDVEEELEWDDDDWDYISERSTDMEFNGTSGENITAHITAHAPETFADLRSRFGISEQIFQTSMLESGPYISFQSNSKGAARAGGVFFFTRDGAYMIKSIKKAEAKTFLEMLPKYHKHMRHNGRKSLLTRFCGMYTVKLTLPGTTTEKEHVFVIMNSVFPAEGSQFISERYDLKGSTVGRECSEEEKATKGSNAVLKDLDLAREVALVKSLNRRSRRASGYGFRLGPTFKAMLLSQLRRDVKLLVECKVMDYSLLVGVVNMDTGRFDVATLEALEQSEAHESVFRKLPARHQRRAKKLKTAACELLAPLQIMSAPVVYFGRRAISLADRTLSSIVTLPLPYYGAGLCGVDGGALAMVEGTRSGDRAVYYVGLIDFLQPWTARKVVERQVKSLMGYNVHAISCVDPEEYASRFLEFIDSHIS